MSTRSLRLAVVVLAGSVAACNSQKSATDQRLAELEKQLADTQQQLAATTQQATPAGAAPASGEPPAATSAPPAPVSGAQPPAPAAARSGAAQPPTPASPSASQRSATGQQAADQSAKDRAEVQRLAEQQKAVNANQATANAQLQQQVDQLKPREFTLPAGTVIPVRTTAELSTERLSDGSAFDALLERDLLSGTTVLAKAGTRVAGFVVTSDPGGRVKGTASLTVGVRSIVGVKGHVIAVTTDSYTADAPSTKKKDTVRTGIATGAGAIIGGIVGGGKGAAIGAGTGAAAGVGTSMATRGAAAVIPSETLVQFRLKSPVTVVLQP